MCASARTASFRSKSTGNSSRPSPTGACRAAAGCLLRVSWPPAWPFRATPSAWPTSGCWPRASPKAASAPAPSSWMPRPRVRPGRRAGPPPARCTRVESGPPCRVRPAACKRPCRVLLRDAKPRRQMVAGGVQCRGLDAVEPQRQAELASPALLRRAPDARVAGLRQDDTRLAPMHGGTQAGERIAQRSRPLTPARPAGRPPERGAEPPPRPRRRRSRASRRRR